MCSAGSRCAPRRVEGRARRRRAVGWAGGSAPAASQLSHPAVPCGASCGPQEIDKYARENVNKLLVGNKMDLGEDGSALRQVPQELGKRFAEEKGIPFLETSAKTGSFVDTAFLMMAHEIKNKMMNVTSKSSDSTNLNSSEKKGCC